MEQMFGLVQYYHSSSCIILNTLEPLISVEKRGVLEVLKLWYLPVSSSGSLIDTQMKSNESSSKLMPCCHPFMDPLILILTILGVLTATDSVCRGKFLDNKFNSYVFQ